MQQSKPEVKRLAVPVAHLHSLAIKHGDHLGSRYEATSLHGRPLKPAKKEKASNAA